MTLVGENTLIQSFAVDLLIGMVFNKGILGCLPPQFGGAHVLKT